MVKKYIDADLLRKEIERRKGYISVTHFIEELLNIIDSLQQEQPVIKKSNALFDSVWRIATLPL